MGKLKTQIIGYVLSRKTLRRQLNKLTKVLPGLRIASYDFVITLGDTNAETNMYFAEYAKYFGKVRELFGLDYIPGFKEKVGHEFFLETIDLYIKYNESLFLGDVLTIDICVGNIESCSFDIFASFKKGDTVCATGIQKVAWCEYKMDEKLGIKVLRPVKIPEDVDALFRSSALF